MASVKLSEKALGSVVTLKENGTAAEFVVACHNYEAGLNGAGRTLLVRKTSLEDKQKWGTKLSIPLEKPDEKKFTFGSASETLSGQQATGTGAAKRAVETLRSVVSYINR